MFGALVVVLVTVAVLVAVRVRVLLADPFSGTERQPKTQ